MIGASARRVEDPVLLRGQGRFADDIQLPGQVHMRVVRSPVAHGVVERVDTVAALAAPGVVAVWTREDVDDVPLIDIRLTPSEELRPYLQPVLAGARARYVGEPVAVVFARTAYQAEDAAELVDVQLRPADPVLDLDGEPVSWVAEGERDGAGRTSEPMTIEQGYGDVDAAFAAASRIVEVDVRVGRHTAVPLECRGALATFDPSNGVLVVDGAAKVLYWNRDAIAAMVGMSPDRVVLREGHVGGGFGVRGELYPEDVLVALGAVRLGTPVKWIEDRQEHLVATNHSRDQRHKLRAAVDDDGLVTAIDGEFWANQGAYVRTHGATVASLTASMLPGPYRVPSYRVRGHIRVSNKTPAGTYRSPGRYESTFARERLMDTVADEVGLDRLEVRRRNFIPAAEMPWQRPMLAMGTELVYDSGDYQLLVQRMHEHWDLDGLVAAVRKRRSRGELVGLGYGCFVEKSGIGPSEGVRVKIDAHGSVTLLTGVSSVGQGVETVLAQVVADVVGVDVAAVRVVRGQTDQFDHGRGAFATRLAVMAGSATYQAAMAVREKAIRVAANLLRCDVADLELVGGRVQLKGDSDRSMGLGEIAQACEPASANRLGLEPGLVADGWHHTDHMTYPYGVHAAIVRIDGGTGQVNVERYLVGYDVGKALNPMLVEGQIVGGVAQGIGGALLEELTYSAEGQPLSTTFMDYLLPTAAEVPRVEVLVTEDAPSPLNPLGIKGAGEGGVNAAGAAVAAAVDDALGRPGAIMSLPVKPSTVKVLLDAEPAGPAGSDGRRSHGVATSSRTTTPRRKRQHRSTTGGSS